MENNKFVIMADRLSAWVLLACIILYAVSGFGMTKGLIDKSLANSLHLNYLAIITLIAFSVHTFWAVHLAFKRWRIWNNLSKAILLIFYVAFIGFFLYVGFFYNNQSKGIQSSSQQVVTQTSKNETVKTFTAESLVKYNGLNGQPAYVAIGGNVYDLSSVYNNGQHFGHKAGIDLTKEFYSEHSANILKRFEIVGTYTK